MSRPNGKGENSLESNQAEPKEGVELREILFRDLIPATFLEAVCYLLLWGINWLEINLPITVPAGAPWWHHTNFDHFFLAAVHLCVGLTMAVTAVVYIIRPITKAAWARLRARRRGGKEGQRVS